MATGNILVVVFFFSSLAWFLTFSIKVINRAMEIPLALPNAASAPSSVQFNIDGLEKIKPLFEREGLGYAVLKKTD